MKAVMSTSLKAPFVYFGGKSMIADVVWRYLGDVKQYIEPFFGSGAVLLKRPPTQHEKIYEIINDKNGFVANVWYISPHCKGREKTLFAQFLEIRGGAK